MEIKFNKYDKDKVRVSLVQPGFILGTAKVLTFGANKYGVDNWKLIPNSEVYRYKDALMRHLLAYLAGEKVDPDSGLLHLDHIAANTMFLRHFDIKLGDK